MVMIKAYDQMSFSEYDIARKAKRNSFYKAVNSTIDWAPIEKDINRVYKKGRSATGRNSYPGLLLFKMLLIQVWYGLSDEATEDMLNDSISAMHFCGLTLEDDVPDHSTLSRFRSELIQKKGLDRILRKFNSQLEKKGLKLKKGAARVDASITESDRRPKGKKEWEITATTDREEDNEKDKQDEQDVKMQLVEKEQPGADKEARWTKKAGKLLFGYKRHILTDEDGLIESVITTPANVHDNQALEDLIMKTGKNKYANGLFADKGYSGWYYEEMLAHYGIKNRIQKKGAKNRPLTKWEKRFNRLISKQRYVVERTFGSMKRWFKSGKTRYMGLAKTHGQHVLEAIAHNLYRITGQAYKYLA